MEPVRTYIAGSLYLHHSFSHGMLEGEACLFFSTRPHCEPAGKAPLTLWLSRNLGPFHFKNQFGPDISLLLWQTLPRSKRRSIPAVCIVDRVAAVRVDSKAERIRDEVPRHRAQLAASEECGLELGRMGSGREVQASLCFA